MLEITATGVVESALGTVIGGIVIAIVSWIWRADLRALWRREVRPRFEGAWARAAQVGMTILIFLAGSALFLGAQWLVLAAEDGIRIECSRGKCLPEDLVAIGKCETTALIEARARTGPLSKIEEKIAFRHYAINGWAACLKVEGYTFTNCKMNEAGCARPRTSW